MEARIKTCGGQENLFDKWKTPYDIVDGTKAILWWNWGWSFKEELGPMEVDNLSQKSEKMVNREMVQ